MRFISRSFWAFVPLSMFLAARVVGGTIVDDFNASQPADCVQDETIGPFHLIRDGTKLLVSREAGVFATSRGGVFAADVFFGDFTSSVTVHREDTPAFDDQIVLVAFWSDGHFVDVFTRSVDRVVGYFERTGGASTTLTDPAATLGLRIKRTGQLIELQFDPGSGFQTVISQSGPGLGGPVQIAAYLLRTGAAQHPMSGWLDDFIVVDGPGGIPFHEQPRSQLLCQGAPAILTVDADNSEPIPYQWRRSGNALFNGGHVLGADSATLHLDPLSADDAGVYDCLVTNSCGAVASDPATLEVYCECSSIGMISGIDDGFALPRDAASPSTSLEDALFNQNPRDLLEFDMVPNVAPPDATPNRSMAHTLSGLPSDLISATLEFRVQAGGSNQQSAEGTDLIRLGFAIGSGAAAEFENQGDNAYFWTRYFGSGNSTEALFTDGTGQPVPWRLGDERLATLDLAALPLATQQGGGTTSFLPQMNAHGYLDFVVSDDSGVDFVRLTGVRSDGTTVVWVGSQPQDQVACSGGVASFEITSGGSDPRTYRWRKDEEDLADGLSASGSSISGASTSMLTLTDVSAADVGAYYCVVANDCSESTSTAAMLTVFDGGTGDGDASGTADGEDIRGFVLALLEGGVASPAYCAFDMNADGVVEFDDTGLFVEQLIGP